MLPGVTGAMGGHSAWLQVNNLQPISCVAVFIQILWHISYWIIMNAINAGAEISFDCWRKWGRKGAEAEVWCQPVQPGGNHGRISLIIVLEMIKQYNANQLILIQTKHSAAQFQIGKTFYIVAVIRLKRHLFCFDWINPARWRLWTINCWFMQSTRSLGEVTNHKIYIKYWFKDVWFNFGMLSNSVKF